MNKIKEKKQVFFGLNLAICISLVFALTLPVFAEESITDLNKKINTKKEEIERIGKKQEEYKQEIKKKQKESAKLENQLAIIEAQIKEIETEIQKTRAEIEKVNLKIEDVENKIQKKKEEIAKQKKILAELVRLMYQYDQADILERLFSYNSFSDFLDQLQAIEQLENKGKETLDKIYQIKEELEQQKETLKKQKATLDDLKKRQDKERQSLAWEKRGKERFLAETQLQEEKYQELLEKSRQEYQQANQEIRALEREIRQKLYEEKYKKEWSKIGGSGKLAWPIVPKQGISSYFLDPTYKAFFGVDHYAIDIPTPQGTPIHAPANGYVVKYRDGGMGYSYIMLYHGNNLSTVYGHVSASYVHSGDYVKKGDIIGLTGGTPGTKGAGWMTTGPHLHFEVRVNGIPVNPLKYLPEIVIKTQEH